TRPLPRPFLQTAPRARSRRRRRSRGPAARASGLNPTWLFEAFHKPAGFATPHRAHGTGLHLPAVLAAIQEAVDEIVRIVTAFRNRTRRGIESAERQTTRRRSHARRDHGSADGGPPPLPELPRLSPLFPAPALPEGVAAGPDRRLQGPERGQRQQP